MVNTGRLLRSWWVPTLAVFIAAMLVDITVIRLGVESPIMSVSSAFYLLAVRGWLRPLSFFSELPCLLIYGALNLAYLSLAFSLLRARQRLIGWTLLILFVLASLPLFPNKGLRLYKQLVLQG